MCDTLPCVDSKAGVNLPGIRVPSEDELPSGPHRSLVLALHRLYSLAGKPSTRGISAAIRDRDDLPGTLSHEGVSAALRGTTLPRWPNLESLIRVLASWTVNAIDGDEEVIRIHSLWVAAGDFPSDEIDSRSAPENSRLQSGVAKNQSADILRQIDSAVDLLPNMENIEPFLAVLIEDGVEEFASALNKHPGLSDSILSSAEVPFVEALRVIGSMFSRKDPYWYAPAIVATMRPANEFVCELNADNRTPSQRAIATVLLVLASRWLPAEIYIDVVNELKVNDRRGHLDVAFNVWARRPISEVSDFMSELRRNGWSNDCYRICAAMTRRSARSILDAVRFFGNQRQEKVKNYILWSAGSRLPDDRLHELLVMFCEEGATKEALRILEAKARQEPHEIIQFLDLLRDRHRYSIAQQLISLIGATSPEHIIETASMFRIVGREDDLTQLIDGILQTPLMEFERMNIVNTFDLMGWVREAGIVRLHGGGADHKS